MAFHGLRGLFGRLEETVYAVAGRAAQVVAWDRDHAFCGRCGTATEPVAGEGARRCPGWGLTAFPRLSPGGGLVVEGGGGDALGRGEGLPGGCLGVVGGGRDRVR